MSVPSCLWCVRLDIGARVEAMYQRLKLTPWHLFRGGPWHPRQSGRTTHGIIEAIALCTACKLDTIVVESPFGHVATRHLRLHARRIVDQLHAGFDVDISRPGVWRNVIAYYDHEGPRCL